MPKISRNKIDQKDYELIISHLVSAFAKLRQNQEIADLMDSLFTKSERLMLAKRLAIATMLEAGKTYPAISKVLKVSSATISFVKNGIMNNNEAYANLIKLLQKSNFKL